MSARLASNMIFIRRISRRLTEVCILSSLHGGARDEESGEAEPPVFEASLHISLGSTVSPRLEHSHSHSPHLEQANGSPHIVFAPRGGDMARLPSFGRSIHIIWTVHVEPGARPVSSILSFMSLSSFVLQASGCPHTLLAPRSVEVARLDFPTSRGTHIAPVMQKHLSLILACVDRTSPTTQPKSPIRSTIPRLDGVRRDPWLLGGKKNGRFPVHRVQHPSPGCARTTQPRPTTKERQQLVPDAASPPRSEHGMRPPLSPHARGRITRERRRRSEGDTAGIHGLAPLVDDVGVTKAPCAAKLRREGSGPPNQPGRMVLVWTLRLQSGQGGCVSPSR